MIANRFDNLPITAVPVTAADDASHFLVPPRPASPSPDQPGRHDQQIDCIELYLQNPARALDPHGAWQLARRLILPHARKARRSAD